jgi:hypothetical protein
MDDGGEVKLITSSGDLLNTTDFIYLHFVPRMEASTATETRFLLLFQK